MKKNHCTIIDHEYHALTHSTQFIVNLMMENYNIDVIHLTMLTESSMQELLDIDTDFFLVFQLDFLVGFLVSNNKKVVSVPMFDQSGGLPRAHWAMQTGALVISYSETLTRQLVAWNLQHVSAKYYPSASEERVQFHDGLRVFFWERIPSQGCDVDWVASICRNMLIRPTHVHVHLWPDPGEVPSTGSAHIARAFPYARVSVSNRFRDKSEYWDALRLCNVFIAPRKVEGIGMAFLEAMSLGMVVIALDEPTMNEYITNEENGLFISSGSTRTYLPELDGWSRIGGAAWNSIRAGDIEWQAKKAEIISNINKYILSYNESHTRPITPKTAAMLAKAFMENRRRYIWHIKRIQNPWHSIIPTRNLMYLTWKELYQRFPIILTLIRFVVLGAVKLIQRGVRGAESVVR